MISNTISSYYDPITSQAQRRKMVQYLMTKGISDERVLTSMLKVPRHLFIDLGLEKIAYEDRALSIGCEQTISQPSTVAFQSQLLSPKPTDKILEIGTGCGYQTAVLYNITYKVYTIERQKQLFIISKQNFDKINIHPRSYYGDGYQGLPKEAPFDKILVTCGAPYVPDNLINQLKIGGIMVIPVGSKEQTMWKITKVSPTELIKQPFGNFCFVPMLENKQR